MKIKIAPSILSADRNNLQADVDKIQDHAELIHVDIMDGSFVPPTTFKPEEIKPIQSNLPKDVHLMVDYPKKDGYIDAYVDAGADSITVHEECKEDLQELINYIKSKGVKAAITIKPATALDTIKPFLDQVDMVLIMSVNPGYAGQKFMPEVLPKVEELRKLKPDIDIEIDGGITSETINQAVKAGANVFVAGSSVFGKEDPVKAINDLRDAIQ